MKYFSGFCLCHEEALFEPYLIQSDMTVAGFSYGAIKAFEYALSATHRIDTLQLFSPAFFMDKDAKFKKLQTLSFSKNPHAYCDNFLTNVTAPSTINISSYFEQGNLEALSELLHYTWEPSKLQALVDKGIVIEVYVGECDAIINALAVKEFFVPFATVYYFKSVGHILH